MNKLFSVALSTLLSANLILGAAAYAALGDGKVSQFIGDENFSSNIYDLNARAGKTGAPHFQPWSGTFWPLRSGSTANPYADRMSFKANQLLGVKANIRKYNRHMQDLRSKVIKGKLDADTIRDLSPAEKYDLYIGDLDFTYTQSEWQSVSEQFNYIGQISLWEGSCHGWSTAAIYDPRPAKAFNVMSLDGKYLIPFFPDDLKALSTRLWANSLIQDFTVAQGMRCTVKKPRVDRTGHVIEDTCKGVNPGDFHVSVLEMVGARKKSFVVNRSNTRQVWNQPVAGYELTYFNPITDKDGELQQSIVYRAGYADPFYQFRDPSVKAIVGVEMKLHYISETSPTHQTVDANKDDKVKTLKLRYDLELDADNRVVGGEWRNKHDVDPEPIVDKNNDGYNDETGDMPKFPGFLWKPTAENPVARSAVNFDWESGDIRNVDRAKLIAASKEAAQFRYKVFTWDAQGNAVKDANGNSVIKRMELRPQPLRRVLDVLFDLAK